VIDLLLHRPDEVARERAKRLVDHPTPSTRPMLGR
jgi:hypothetical protein